MNAQPHAIAHALATALAHASFADSVSAKGREWTGQHRTGPNGVLSFWSPSIHSVQDITREATSAATSTSAPTSPTSWMRTATTTREVLR